MLYELSSIVKKCVSRLILKYFEEKKIFTNSQFKFKANKSTVRGILAFEDRCFNAVLSCDLSKAFDCVDHVNLLLKIVN